MKRGDNAGGKAVKSRRRKTLKQRAGKAARQRNFSPGSKELNVTRLSRNLSEAFEQQAATAEILNVISRSPTDTQPVFDAIVQSGLKLFPGALISVALRYGNTINAAAIAETDPARAEAWQRTISRTPLAREYMHGAALLDRRIVDIPDVMDAPAEFAVGARNFLTSGYRAITIMPMMRNDEAIGLLSVVRLAAGPLSDKQIALLRTFAAQAIIAIENTRLLNELRQRTDELGEALEQQTATGEVLRIISTMPGNLQPVFDAILGNAIRICEAHHGILQLYDGENFHAQALRDVPPAYADVLRSEPRRAGPTTGLGRLVATRQPIHIADCAAEPAYAKRVRERVQAVELGGVRSSVVVPLLKGDTVLGGLQINRQEVRPFGDKQIELVASFAAQAVIAIENTRLLNELHRRTDDLSEALEQQTATAEILSVISNSLTDTQPVFDAIVQSAVSLFPDALISIALKDGDMIRGAAAVAVSDPVRLEAWRRTFPYPLTREYMHGRAILDCRVVDIPDVTQAPPELAVGARNFLTSGYRAITIMPMIRGDAAIGAISVIRGAPGPLSDKQISVLKAFAAQAVIAIENTRLLTELRQRTDDLTDSLEELRTTQDRLVQTEKLASLGQLTAGIAHEIKNPLNFVNNFSGISTELIDELQVTIKGPLDDKARAEITELTDTLRGNLDKIVQHGKRADAIVKNMLQHSREGSGEHRPVNINALVEESLNLAWHGARAEKQNFEITLKQSFDPSAGEIDVFPQDITRALLNFISNGFYAATKRNSEGNGGNYEPTLTAATKSLGDRVEISIRDNGNGIPPDVKEKMFNPFFTTKPTGEGTGLGLSISHDIIVKQHGGSIEVETQPGEFTEIIITLPRAAVFV